jgi:hypothetical protein
VGITLQACVPQFTKLCVKSEPAAAYVAGSFEVVWIEGTPASTFSHFWVILRFGRSPRVTRCSFLGAQDRPTSGCVLVFFLPGWLSDCAIPTLFLFFNA